MIAGSRKRSRWICNWRRVAPLAEGNKCVKRTGRASLRQFRVSVWRGMFHASCYFSSGSGGSATSLR